MNIDLLLSLSYVLPLALMVWTWLGYRLSVKGKFALTLTLPVLYLLHWFGLQQIKGWPSDRSLPPRFELISADILEPNPLQETKGNIHLWVRPAGSHTPRSYVLQYSRALHKKLFETKQRTAQGRAQMGMLYDQTLGGSGANVGNGKKLDFKDMPQRLLPPKAKRE